MEGHGRIPLIPYSLFAPSGNISDSDDIMLGLCVKVALSFSDFPEMRALSRIGLSVTVPFISPALHLSDR